MSKGTLTVKDVVEEVIIEIEAEDISNSDKEVLANVQQLINELKGSGTSGKNFSMFGADELSKIGGSLAILKVNLAEMLAKSNRLLSISKDVSELKKANNREVIITYLEQHKIKPTIDNIKSEMRKRFFRDSMRNTFREENYEKLIYLWRAVNSVLDMVQSRITVLSRQASETNWLDQVPYPIIDPKLEGEKEPETFEKDNIFGDDSEEFQKGTTPPKGV